MKMVIVRDGHVAAIIEEQASTRKGKHDGTYRVRDDVVVQEGWKYDPKKGTFIPVLETP